MVVYTHVLCICGAIGGNSCDAAALDSVAQLNAMLGGRVGCVQAGSSQMSCPATGTLIPSACHPVI